MKLTDIKIRSLKPKSKLYKVTDGQGLYIAVTPTGSKYWRYKYRFLGTEKLLALGVYPEITLSEARAKMAEARKLLIQNIDPSADKKRERTAIKQSIENSFEAVARAWHKNFSPKWSADHATTIINRLETYIFKGIGNKPITDITAAELLALIRLIEIRGHNDTARRVLQFCNHIFLFANRSDIATNNPAAALKGVLSPVITEHYASITDPKEIAGLLRAINGYKGSFETICALKLAPLVFLRPGELRSAEWGHISLESSEWRIPGANMKMGEVHIVPLSRQAIAILRELNHVTGNGKYLFPGVRTPGRHMSENTVNSALRRMGYTSDQMTGHGFRSMASTLLNEQGFDKDVIERQLAHKEQNKVRAAYNYAQYLPQRRLLMQHWADYLDSLKNHSPTTNLMTAIKQTKGTIC